MFGQSSTFGQNASTTSAPVNPFATTATTTTTNPNPNPFLAPPAAPTNGTASAPTAGTTSLFGNTQPVTTGTTSLFGNTAAKPGGLFGSTTSTTTPSTGTGLFGTTPATNPTGTGLFGSTSTTPASAPPTTTLFGSTTTPAAPTAPAAPTTGTGGLFGSTTTPSAPTTGGFFGSSNPGTTPASTGGLFGSSTSQPSLFGNTATTTSTQQPANSSPFSLSTSTTSPFSLGQSTSTSTLAKPATPSLLQPSASTSLFGSKAAPAPPTSPNAASEFALLKEKIEAIIDAWNPQSPNCIFQHYFYNLVDPAQISMYGRPPQATNEALWQRALRENPDATCMVPVLAIGFDDLQKRVEGQAKTAAAHQEKLKDLQTRLAALSNRALLQTSLRSQKLSLAQATITHRMNALIQHLHLLIPSVRASSIRPEEEALRTGLDSIEEELKRGSISRGRINEIWGLLAGLQGVKEGKGESGVEWKVVDQEGLDRLTKILMEQQQGLAHLTKILQDDLRDLAVIKSNIASGVVPAQSLARTTGGYKGFS